MHPTVPCHTGTGHVESTITPGQTFDGKYIKCVLLLMTTFWDEALEVFWVGLQPIWWTCAAHCEMSLFYLNSERAMDSHAYQLSFSCYAAARAHLICSAYFMYQLYITPF